MTDRPILYSAPMVRALLSGAKTQTRRVVKFRGAEVIEDRGKGPQEAPWPWSPQHDGWVSCPFGVPGDRLWVRETWGLVRPTDPTDWKRGPIKERDPRTFWDVAFRADYGLGQMYREPDADIGYWRPSIHMPRWASRITLEVTGVRVERLNDISEEDAMAEGVERDSARGGNWLDYQSFRDGRYLGCVYSARDSFMTLWESIGPGSWALNPWVWVVEFKRVTP